MVGNKNTLPTRHCSKWWATKTRYPPDIAQNGGQQKPVTHPTKRIFADLYTLSIKSISVNHEHQFNQRSIYPFVSPIFLVWQ
ncbi:MAG TPA: hypothetical protein ENF37_00835 [Beggiatoa sp.]|nr:MAG: hypothetical protein DRQ99_04185 [Gammaproteobacteria bacterium]HEW97178.1 hypothetical protein [Beggiatoa sp.]